MPVQRAKEKKTEDWMSKLARVPEWAYSNINVEEEVQLIWFADARIELHRSLRGLAVVYVRSACAADFIVANHLTGVSDAVKQQYPQADRFVVMPDVGGSRADTWLTKAIKVKEAKSLSLGAAGREERTRMVGEDGQDASAL